MKAKLQAVEVYWNDSHSINGWGDASDIKERAENADGLCRTVGMLVSKNKKKTVIVQNVAIDDDGVVWCMSDTLTIPTKVIKKITEL